MHYRRALYVYYTIVSMLLLSLIIVSASYALDNQKWNYELTFLLQKEFRPAFDICHVVRVIDGDTFVADCQLRKRQHIRLLDVDTFEVRKSKRLYKQASAYNIDPNQAKQFGLCEKTQLEKLVSNKVVFVILYDRRYGVYGRLLADVVICNYQTCNYVNKRMRTIHSSILKTLSTEEK